MKRKQKTWLLKRQEFKRKHFFLFTEGVFVSSLVFREKIFRERVPAFEEADAPANGGQPPQSWCAHGKPLKAKILVKDLHLHCLVGGTSVIEGRWQQ